MKFRVSPIYRAMRVMGKKSKARQRFQNLPPLRKILRLVPWLVVTFRLFLFVKISLIRIRRKSFLNCKTKCDNEQFTFSYN